MRFIITQHGLHPSIVILALTIIAMLMRKMVAMIASQMTPVHSG